MKHTVCVCSKTSQDGEEKERDKHFIFVSVPVSEASCLNSGMQTQSARRQVPMVRQERWRNWAIGFKSVTLLESSWWRIQTKNDLSGRQGKMQEAHRIPQIKHSGHVWCLLDRTEHRIIESGRWQRWSLFLESITLLMSDVCSIWRMYGSWNRKGGRDKHLSWNQACCQCLYAPWQIRI